MADSTIPSRTPKRQARPVVSSVQIMFAAILSIGLMLALTLSNRIQADQALQEIHDQVVQEIELLRQEQVELIEELNWVRSDAFVESWAHDEGKMVREGEVLVIPIPSTIILDNDEPDENFIQIAPIDTTPPEPESWELWWALFFDSDPPSS